MVDRDAIAARYHDGGETAEAIAAAEGVTVRSVYRWMTQAGRPAGLLRADGATVQRRAPRAPVPIDPSEIEAGGVYRIVGHRRSTFKALQPIGDGGWRFYCIETMKNHAFRNEEVLR